MAGVVITTPVPVEPYQGQKVLDATQPLSIVIEEAHTNGPRAITMAFQIAADVGFTNIMYSQAGIVPTGEGLTRLRLPDRLPSGRNYFWRIKGEDGANSSGWSNAAAFEILQPIVIGTPDPQSPVANVRVSNGTPEFKVRNGQSSGPYQPLWYNFQISDNQTFATVFANAIVNEGGGGETRYTMPQLPAPDKTFFWRVRISDGPNVGNWSRTESFRSPVAPAPTPSPGPGPSPGGGNPGNCASNNGSFIVVCIGSKYPEKLAPVGSLGERQANMMFLRDRIIEAGKCGGLNLGWNLKRGGPERSIDFLADRRGGGDMGVDIAADYDNIGNTLRLQWFEAGFGATWEAYPAVTCG
jgi:hypothetical protein